MSIKQLNVTYLLQEDRILFRINTKERAEFSFVLTRRVALFILAASTHLVEKMLEQKHDPVTAKAVADFEQKNLVSSNCNGPEFEPGETFPLGNQALLVLDVTCGLADAEGGGEQQFSIDFVLAKNQSINLKLPKPMLIALRLLLENLCDQASWGRAVIAPSSPETSGTISVDTPISSSTIH
jgi:hypothetical protein